jgi:amino acid transporter
MVVSAGSQVETPSQLRRALTFRTIVSMSTGLAFAAISFLGCIQMAGLLPGDSAWIAMLISAGLALVVATCFGELNGLYPTAAAARQFIGETIDERFSLIVSFTYLGTIVTLLAADGYIVARAITYVWPAVPTLLLVAIILTLACAVNLRGISLTGLLQDIVTYSLVVFAIGFSTLVLLRHGIHLHAPFGAFGQPGNLIQAVAVGVFVYAGFEWVTPMSEEIRDTGPIPLGMFVAIGLLCLSYTTFTLASTTTLHVASESVQTSPVPQMLLARRALGEWGVGLMLAATLVTGVMTFNGGIATASRFLYAAARDDNLPPVFARINRAGVPSTTIVFLIVCSAVVSIVVAATNQFQILILVGAVLEAGVYALVGLCIVVLRHKYPQAVRTFHAPLGLAIPVSTMVIFTLLALIAGTTPTIWPLLIVLAAGAVATLYTIFYVPRLRVTQAKAPAGR